MQIFKLTAIALFGILLTACNANQMQIEGSAASPTLGKMHTHLMPDGSTHKHQHGGDSSSSHSHKLSDLQ